MKRFLCRVFIFICALFLIWLAVSFMFYKIVSDASFEVPAVKDTIVLGTSIAASNIDDEVFFNAINMAEESAPLIYSYIKLREFSGANPNIKNVLLPLSFGNFLRDKGAELVFDYRLITLHLPHYITLFNNEDAVFYFKNSLKHSTIISAALKFPVKILPQVWQYFLQKKLTYKDLFIGGYRAWGYVMGEEDAADAEEHIFERDEKFEYSPEQVLYLLKTAALCKERNLNLVLCAVPAYDIEPLRDSVKNLKLFLSEYCPDVSFIDFSEFPVPKGGFADGVHFNSAGAAAFSRYLMERDLWGR